MATNAVLGPAWLVAQDWAQPVDEVGTSESVAATTAAQDSDTEDEVGTSIRRRTTPEQMDLSVLSQGGSLRKRVNSLIAEALRCPNKGKLEEFLDNLDACLSRMTREPDDSLLRQAQALEVEGLYPSAVANDQVEVLHLEDASHFHAGVFCRSCHAEVDYLLALLVQLLRHGSN